jgi:hypothetical protein
MSLRTLLDIPDGVPPKSRARSGSGKAHQERPPADRARRGASAHLIARHTPQPVQTGSEHRGRNG